MHKKSLIIFLFLSFALITLSEITKIILEFDSLLYNSLAEKLTYKQLNQYLQFQKKWKWITYLFIPLFILIKTNIITIILYLGTYLLNKKEVAYKSIWTIVIKAEFIFLLVPIFKILWFYFFQQNYDLSDIQNFHPLSALNIVGYKNLEPWFIYPFQVLNLFELFYIIYLSFQIGKLTHKNADYGLKIVGISYVPTLFLWVAIVMFFTLNYS
ncbi:hypothetical protein LPB248_13510 [Flavobacterium sp. LPB0248]|uniref:hypothetical protein n=1 Tax=Flavobacterium sp. LPB0248 TaxID=2614441 RepID=UPI0015A5DC5D|nr:hypothetical protein [Flavobacterium sp. LPB0248]QLC67281.1 hypothetical protein LPB248_13510 [Flavobacterium sp. LPB0248]